MGTRLPDQNGETLHAVTDRRSAALEKIAKRISDRQTDADIEKAMGKRGGDDQAAYLTRKSAG